MLSDPQVKVIPKIHTFSDMRVRDRSSTRPEARQAVSVWQNRAQQGRTNRIDK